MVEAHIDEATHEPVTHRLERAATWLSLACAVHCMAVPLLAMMLPLVGGSLTVLDSPPVELALSIFVMVSALAGAAWGFRRHRDARIVTTMLAGLVVYVLGHLLDAAWYGHVISVSGAMVLALSSFQSARLGHRHSAQCAH